MSQIRKNTTGFTLVEVLVTLFILSVALSGALAVISSQISAITLATNNLIAGNLAQEAMELVRNLRDSDWHAGRAFGPTSSSLPAGAYRIQWDSTSLMSLVVTPLLRDTNGFYNYTNGTQTNFYRSVTISYPSSYEMKAIINVSWKDRSRFHLYTSELHLYNWYE